MSRDARGVARRDFLKLTGAGALAASVAWPAGVAAQGERKPHELPDLPYDYDALEPHYDEQTLRIHHDKHHAGYVRGLNGAEEKLATLLADGDFSQTKPLCKALAFHGSGHLFHSLFWTNMGPDGGGEPDGGLARAVQASFGGFEPLKGLFLAAANSVAGSGWGVLAYRPFADDLVVLQAEKHENFAQWGAIPLLVCDVWEHAYYLKYQNRRSEWTAAFVENLVNWDDVAKRLEAARELAD